MSDPLLLKFIGFTAQAFFSARILVQWILSERAKKVISPSLYWILSILGSYLLFIYGWFREDFAIIFGQMIAYYVYIWNLNEKGVWPKLHVFFRVMLMATPVAVVVYMFRDLPGFVETFFRNEDVPLLLLIYGSAGQVIFTLRFVYQWYYSYRRHESILPVGFWIISLVGSAVIVSYGVFRNDIVLIIGQSTGFVAYMRNIILHHHEMRSKVLSETSGQTS